MEEWRVIEEFPNYEVSNFGNVRAVGAAENLSYRRQNNMRRTPRVLLRRDGHCYTSLVANLVLAAFGSPRPEGAYPRYKDGNPYNICADNLYWDEEPHVGMKGKKVRIKEYGHVFESVSEAAKALECTRTGIRYALKRSTNTISGLHLEWVDG